MRAPGCSQLRGIVTRGHAVFPHCIHSRQPPFDVRSRAQEAAGNPIPGGISGESYGVSISVTTDSTGFGERTGAASTDTSSAASTNVSGFSRSSDSREVNSYSISADVCDSIESASVSSDEASSSTGTSVMPEIRSSRSDTAALVDDGSTA